MKESFAFYNLNKVGLTLTENLTMIKKDEHYSRKFMEKIYFPGL